MTNPLKILIVGGTGTLGQPTTRLLSQSGYQIFVMTRKPGKADQLQMPNIKEVRGDLTDAASLTDACKGIDIVIAMAHAMLGTGKYASQKVDLAGHLSLVASARSAGVKRMIYLSILGANADHRIDFWRNKHAIEQSLIHSEMTYTIVRSAAFMETHVHMLLGKGILTNGKTIIFGKGDNPTNFISVVDIASLHKAVIENPASQNRVIEIGGPDNISKNDVAALYFSLANKPVKITHLSPGFLKIMSKIMKPIHPGIARVLLVSVVVDETDQTFTPSSDQKEFHVSLTSIKDFVKQQVSQPIVRL